MEVNVLSIGILVFYSLAWGVTFLKQKRNTDGIGPALFVIGTYLVYSVISIVYYNNYFGRVYGDVYLFPLIYLYFMLMLALSPAMKYERINFRFIQKPSPIVLYVFIISYGISAFVTLPNAISKIQTGFALLFSNSTSGAELYLAERANATVSDHSISGIIGLFSSFHGFFRDISIFVFFYYLSLKERVRTISIYLAIVLIVDLVISIASGGRTPFVMILITIFIGYFLFRDFWDEKYRKIMRTIGIVIIAISMIPFITLTISRFGNSSNNNGAADSIIEYVGMENLMFDRFAFDSNGIRFGDRTANEFKRMLGFDVPNGVNETRTKYSNMRINDSKFITFVGDFVLDFGPIFASLLFLIFSTLTSSAIKANMEFIPFHKLLLVFFSLCVCGQGGMYLFYYSFQRNWMIIAFVFMYIVFYYDYSKHRGNYRFLEKTISEGKARRKKLRFVIKTNR